MTNSTSTHCLSPQTILAHGGQTVEDHVGSIVQPIYPGTTFVRNSDYSLQNDEFSYSRSGMPNWSPVEHVMCELEGGFAARLFGSGLAACLFSILVAVLIGNKSREIMISGGAFFWH